jgi:hypothetical protein
MAEPRLIRIIVLDKNIGLHEGMSSRHAEPAATGTLNFHRSEDLCGSRDKTFRTPASAARPRRRGHRVNPKHPPRPPMTFSGPFAGPSISTCINHSFSWQNAWNGTL